VRRGLKSVALFIAFAVIFTLSRHAIGSSSTTTTTTPTSPSTSTSAVASSTTSTPAITTSTCVASNFAATYNFGAGAAGTAYGSVTLAMKSGSTCTLVGYPIVTLQDKYGAVLHEVIVEIPRSSSAVQFPDAAANANPVSLTLSPGMSVTEDLAYNDIPVGKTGCENIASLSLQFGANGPAVVVTPSYALVACNGGKIWLSPYFH
jgi:Protein of unknown function (DUF4232)